MNKKLQIKKTAQGTFDSFVVLKEYEVAKVSTVVVSQIFSSILERIVL
jgi:hypothetical protein